ncbi:MAG: 2-amino-4-hydroxy-6-hydroxymethyldihydropteridine diphosphokinase [Candidatus Neomarinimicrobiota bacterium]|jgi:2-amino-4-hydroxy-6-hydroxymethyldihydropteridine diphosphokinase|nr:2-amino-4-hydroxy-6-hydroxymethyldihydropteridine diphosphokinase [Candidatus Neomarinimicrobiota bacterium]MEC9007420.1 2-amino-4-hydroxy-6-hydroxymethyldihydropteridine diphosphokinase [Candidatus Neomarinimicrobiota bacterium]MED5434304.1 2-amino-4-hydroxy-6-hydroxymethyldihydropteridine diphosphokinase [Candidatus Neomarinimicrobiota bacterium]|tara:strand:- start:246 stop:755 length:510 start_codon:yes stop_codon:yes gene_type:complete
MMNQLVYLGLGANIGDRESNLFTAIAALDVRDDISVNRTASIYETDPKYNLDQPKFLNCVVEIDTTLQPEVMLQVCQGIEMMLGRPSSRKKNEPRVIDIDILAYETISVELGELIIPHPDLFARKFVLVPWAEIAPNFVVQDYGKTVSDLLSLCPDASNVQKYKLEKTA